MKLCDRVVISGPELNETTADYAMRLNQIGNEEYRRGHLDQAETCHRKALEIREAIFHVLDETHPDYPTSRDHYAMSLNNLASVHNETGRFLQAGSRYLEALKIREAILDELADSAPDHVAPGYLANLNDYVAVLNNLASVYEYLGDHTQAEQLYVQVLKTFKMMGRTTHYRYVRGLNNLADVHVSMQKFDKAESRYMQAAEIIMGSDSREDDYMIPTMTNNVAELFHSRGELAQAQGKFGQAQAEFLEAERFYIEALRLLKDRHLVRCAKTLNNLAALYVLMKKFAEAELRYNQALKILKQGHVPDYAAALGDLASLYVLLGKFAAAKSLYITALDLSRDFLEQTAVIQSERQQMASKRIYRRHLDAYLSLVLSHHTTENPRAVYERILRWKGAVFVRQRWYRQVARDYPGLFNELLHKVQRLDSHDDMEDSINFRIELDRLETQVARQSPDFSRVRHKVNLDGVAAALPNDFVLVDFLEFGEQLPNQIGNLSYQRSIMASVVRRNGTVKLFHLGEIQEMEIQKWLACMGERNPSKKEEVDCAVAGQKLRETLWEPILPALRTASTVLVSPDGILGRLPWAALPGASHSTYLIDTYQIALLPIPQLLPTLIMTSERQEGRKGLLLVGDVDYDNAAPEMQEEGLSAIWLRFWKTLALSLGLVRQEWSQLEGTYEEVKTIGEFFKANPNFGNDPIQMLRGSEATKERFLELAPHFAHLHLATHGYFKPPGKHVDLTALGFDPRRLSRLVFAGANRYSGGPYRSVGIVTATEVAFLPLEGVDLVTLSACETGLGAIAGGEGLLGFQRAFQVSGARSTVTGLWKVNNLATRPLMERFYENLWSKRMPRLQALREAQLWLKDKSGYSRPYYWAAFQLSGAWY